MVIPKTCQCSNLTAEVVFSNVTFLLDHLAELLSSVSQNKLGGLEVEVLVEILVCCRPKTLVGVVRVLYQN